MVTVTAACLAVTYALLGVIGLTILLPRGQTSSAGAGTLASLAEHGTGWWLATRWLFLLTALFGLGLIAGIRRLAPPDRAAPADWAAAVGALGFTAVALDQTRLLSHMPGLVRAAAADPDRARDITNLSFVNLTDRYGLLTFGAVGLWLLVTSLACLPNAVPSWLKVTGGLVGCVFITLAAFEASWTSVLASMAALTLAPAFFGGLAARAHHRDGRL